MRISVALSILAIFSVASVRAAPIPKSQTGDEGDDGQGLDDLINPDSSSHGMSAKEIGITGGSIGGGAIALTAAGLGGRKLYLGRKYKKNGTSRSSLGMGILKSQSTTATTDDGKEGLAERQGVNGEGKSRSGVKVEGELFTGNQKGEGDAKKSQETRDEKAPQKIWRLLKTALVSSAAADVHHGHPLRP